MHRSARRGPWLPDEDKALLHLVQSQGANNWVRISQQLQHRSPKQCRERYHQNLKPSLKHEPITAREGEVIEQMVAELGKRWAEIARHLGNRSDNAVKNWWNGSMNRRRRNPTYAGRGSKQVGSRIQPIPFTHTTRSNSDSERNSYSPQSASITHSDQWLSRSTETFRLHHPVRMPTPYKSYDSQEYARRTTSLSCDQSKPPPAQQKREIQVLATSMIRSNSENSNIESPTDLAPLRTKYSPMTSDDRNDSRSRVIDHARISPLHGKAVETQRLPPLLTDTKSTYETSYRSPNQVHPITSGSTGPGYDVWPTDAISSKRPFNQVDRPHVNHTGSDPPLIVATVDRKVFAGTFTQPKDIRMNVSSLLE